MMSHAAFCRAMERELLLAAALYTDDPAQERIEDRAGVMVDGCTVLCRAFGPAIRKVAEKYRKGATKTFRGEPLPRALTLKRPPDADALLSILVTTLGTEDSLT